MLNPETGKLLMAIDDHLYQVKQIRENDLAPATKRIEYIEGMIRDCRERIAEIEGKP